MSSMFLAERTSGRHRARARACFLYSQRHASARGGGPSSRLCSCGGGRWRVEVVARRRLLLLVNFPLQNLKGQVVAAQRAAHAANRRVARVVLDVVRGAAREQQRFALEQGVLHRHVERRVALEVLSVHVAPRRRQVGRRRGRGAEAPQKNGEKSGQVVLGGDVQRGVARDL